jgi:hypothetical protein
VCRRMVRFEDDLRTKMSKTRLPVTVGQYINRLRVINENKPVSSLKFLLDFEGVMTRLDGMTLAKTTKLSYLTAICAVLSTFKRYSRLYQRYREKVMEQSAEQQRELGMNEKTDKQKESMRPLDEIIIIRDKLKAEFDESPAIDVKVWTKLMGYLVLCLYSMIPARRNKDFSEMFFCFDEPKEFDKTKNYYIASTRTFVFNAYKTSKVYGTQSFVVPDCLAEVLENYIYYYQQVIERDYTMTEEYPLLVSFNGERLHPVNGMTRLLNKVVGSKVGSTALRHIFLTDKYGEVLKEMKEDACMMAHSIEQQKEYVKN